MTDGGALHYALGYYFLNAVAFPADLDAIEFPTVLRMFGSDPTLTTRIEPSQVKDLPKSFVPFKVTTYTEHSTPVYADGKWHDYYVQRIAFLGFLWPDEKLFIAASSRDVVNGFVRTVRIKMAGEISLQSLKVDVDRLLANTPAGALALTLERKRDSGDPAYVRRMKAEGRELGDAPEVQGFRESGGVGSGMEFSYAYEGYEIPLSVAADGMIRLHHHIGENATPNLPKELAIVTDCWKQRVARFHEVKPLTQRVKKSHGPTSVEGQKALDELLKPRA